MFNAIPLFYYPTETIIVDDNKQFALNLKLSLGKGSHAKIFTNPKEALEYLLSLNFAQNSFLTKHAEESIDPHDIFKRGVVVDLSELYKQIYDHVRFKTPAVIIVDYGMPQINGEEFCKEIQGKGFKIIMLTGEADVNMAVHLFNKGLIDKFILKSKLDYTEEVAEYVKALRLKYFVDLSDKILASLNPNLKNILSNRDYVRIFEKLFLDNEMVESYVSDDSGSQMLIDSKAEKPKWFLVKTEDDMDMFCELARNDPGTPHQVIEWLEKREKLTHFRNSEDNAVSAKYWPLFDAQKIETPTGTYYYSIVSENEFLKLDKKKILSYDKFLSEPS